MHPLRGCIAVLGCLINANAQYIARNLTDFGIPPDALLPRDDVAPGIELRILPLGASITAGEGSTTGNGFRQFLQEDLQGTKMQYVGSLRSGDFADNYHEGHSGFTIQETQDTARYSIPFKPNLILIHVGTNDVQQNLDGKNSFQHLDDLMVFLLHELPDAVLLVAKIIGSGEPKTNAQIAAFNLAISVWAKVQNDHLHVQIVDMTSIGADQLVDGIHPNDDAYKFMASQWHDAIKEVVKKGWVKNPVGPDPKPMEGAGQGCHKKRDLAVLESRDLAVLEPRAHKDGHWCSGPVIWSSSGRLSHGVGKNGDHKFNQKWTYRGYAFGDVGDGLGPGKDGQGLIFADLRGTGRTDMIWREPKKGALFVWFNDGDGTRMLWNKANGGKEFLPAKCTPNRQRFADLRGTGRADLVCIVGDDGIDVYWNDYSTGGGFKWDGPHRIHNGGPGANRDSIQFMDFDGNGRDDIVIKGPKGELHGILNFGKLKDASNIYWHDVGQIASGTGTSNIVFGDINNDGRDDIIIFNTWNDGGCYGFLNVRGLQEGRPLWVRQDHIESTEHWAPPDLRIAEVTGNGLTDYVLVGPKYGGFRLYANNGNADASVIGDGTWLAKPIATGVNAKRHQYRLADIDGDGKADMVIVNDDGSIKAWLNSGENPKALPRGWVWTEQGPISPAVGDADGGDGKADLIWLDEQSRMTIYRNDYDPKSKHWGFTKITTETIDLNAQYRKDMRFADIDGDQKADAIWVHPWDGTTVVWLNKGTTNRKGWVRSTTYPKTIDPSHQPCAGDNVLFARIHVPWGRADYVIVDPQVGSVTVWKNGCQQYADGSNAKKDNDGGSSGALNGISGSLVGSNGPISCGDLVIPGATAVPAPIPVGGSGSSGSGSSDSDSSGGSDYGSSGGSSGGSSDSGSSGSSGSSYPGSSVDNPDPGDVYIDPGIWQSPNPGVFCVPPCVLILPPWTLPQPTTISFPLLTTSLEVAHKTSKVVTVNGKTSTSTGYDRVTQTTVLTIPPITTTEIEFWNVNITDGSHSALKLTESILPPPFVITNDQAPGITDKAGTRTITPPPFPYDSATPTLSNFPSVLSFTAKGGDDHGKGTKGGPPCKTHCGNKCGHQGGLLGLLVKSIFCNKPCLLNCFKLPHPDFIDPFDPDPRHIDLPPGFPPPGPPPGPPGKGPHGGGSGDNPPDDNDSQSTESSSKSCTTRTVTDFYVSCSTISSGSTSCTTTKTSVLKGCSVTATTESTATGSFCPLITLDPNDDQGEDGTSIPSSTTAPDAKSSVSSVSVNHGGGLMSPDLTSAPPPPPPPPPKPTGPEPTCGNRDGIPGMTLEGGDSWASYTLSDMEAICRKACFTSYNYPAGELIDFHDKDARTVVRLDCMADRYPYGVSTTQFTMDSCFDGVWTRLGAVCGEWGGILDLNGIRFKTYAHRFDPGFYGPT
ncbi:MAG: hypothetical protein Q9212_001494 [Teloschistes hypoglaucus]